MCCSTALGRSQDCGRVLADDDPTLTKVNELYASLLKDEEWYMAFPTDCGIDNADWQREILVTLFVQRLQSFIIRTSYCIRTKNLRQLRPLVESGSHRPHVRITSPFWALYSTRCRRRTIYHAADLVYRYQHQGEPSRNSCENTHEKHKQRRRDAKKGNGFVFEPTCLQRFWGSAKLVVLWG